MEIKYETALEAADGGNHEAAGPDPIAPQVSLPLRLDRDHRKRLEEVVGLGAKSEDDG